MDSLDNPVKLTNREWSEATQQIKQNTDDIVEDRARLNRHSETIKRLERNYLELPMSIEKAVSKGMQEVLNKVMEHEAKFQALETQKLSESLMKAQQELEEVKQRKEHYRKVVFGCFITSAISGVLSFYIAALLNNLAG